MKFMNWLNRAVIVIACLVLMVVLTVLFVFPHTLLEGLGRWMMDWGIYFGRQETWARLGVGIALAVVVDILLLVVIFLEVRRNRQRYLRVQKVAGGMATISVESVTELLQYRLDPLPGVITVVPEIRAKGNKVDARVEVGMSRGSNVPETAGMLIKVVQSVLTDELGMQIAGRPEVQVTVLTRDDDATASTAPPLPLTGGPVKDQTPNSVPPHRENAGKEVVHPEPDAPGNDEA